MRICKNPGLTVRDVLNIIILYLRYTCYYRSTPMVVRDYLLPTVNIKKLPKSIVIDSISWYTGSRRSSPELDQFLDEMRAAPMRTWMVNSKLKSEQEIVNELEAWMHEWSNALPKNRRYSDVPIGFNEAIGLLNP